LQFKGIAFVLVHNARWLEAHRKNNLGGTDLKPLIEIFNKQTKSSLMPCAEVAACDHIQNVYLKNQRTKLE